MSRTPDAKARLRARYRALRADIGREQRQTWTAELNRHLLAAAPLREARRVAAYLAFDGEPDLRFTITQLHRRGVAVALPTVPGSDEGTLNFVSWTPATPLQPNRFGISEPRGMEAVKLADVDIVLLPLVAFDDQGGRLGMGAGWYDRALAAEDVGALRVGVGWSVQQAEDLPRDPWDVPLDAVVTEQGWFTCPDRTAKIASPSPGKTGVTE